MWGALPQGGAQRFSLNQSLPGGGSRKLGLDGDSGVVLYDWPVSSLSVDWVRGIWGVGRFQANWLVVDDAGKLIPRGRSRIVDIVGGPARARGARNGAPPAAAIGFGQDAHGAYSSPAPPPAPMPPQVVDMRVAAAQDIAADRIRAQREIFKEQLEWQQKKAEERHSRLEERLDELERRGPAAEVLYDDDDEPSVWELLAKEFLPLAPMVREVLPDLLKRLAAGGPKALG